MLDFKKYHLLTTLLKIDYPIIFVCTSEKNDFLLCVESESNDAFEQWVGCFLTSELYYELIYGECSLQTAFKLKESRSYYEIKHNFNDDSYLIEIKEGIPDDVIDFGVSSIYKCKDTGNILLDTYFSDEKTFGFDFNPHSEKHEINASFFGELVLNIKSYINNYIEKLRDNNLTLKLAPESFLLRFEYKGSETTEGLIANAVDSLYRIITADNYDQLEDAVSEIAKISVLNPVKKIFNCLSKADCDFYMFSNSNNMNKKYKKLSLPKITTINKSIKSLNTVSEPIDFVGTLKAYDTVSRTFKFEKDDVLIKGKFSSDFKIEQQLVLKEYRGFFKKIIYKNENNNTEKTLFELLKLGDTD